MAMKVVIKVIISSLLVHTKCHFGIKNFKCEYPGCAKAFCQYSELQMDTRRCPKAFSCKSGLTIHTNCHLGIKNFKCEYPGCARAFLLRSFNNSYRISSRNKKLQIHHLGIKNFKCEYPGCARAFYQKADLTIHTKYHLGIKNFKCEYPGYLQEHTKYHLKIKNFKCEYPRCNKAFYQNVAC
ncbi:16083_t:CDS:2 [Entrophospora sp. SA101]|nr:16083_t:CDS:2 [Entrophospora sp. SA101]